MPEPIFLFVPGLAQVINVKPSTIYAWTRETGLDSIPRVRLGKRYGFDLQDVIQWLKTRQDPRQQRTSTRVRRLPARIRRRPRDKGL